MFANSFINSFVSTKIIGIGVDVDVEVGTCVDVEVLVGLGVHVGKYTAVGYIKVKFGGVAI